MFTIEQITIGSWKAVCYALTNSAGTIVIDPGAQPEALVRWLGEKNVIGIILTHCHSDHIGAVNELVDTYGCWVACGADDVDGVADVHRSGFDDEGIDYTVDHVDRPLNEGDTITWGKDHLTVLHTPGHTPGSICLLNESQRVLFTGDMLFAGAIGSTAFVMGNPADMMRSCARLARMNADLTVYPGHGRATSLKVEQPLLIIMAGPALRGGMHGGIGLGLHGGLGGGLDNGVGGLGPSSRGQTHISNWREGSW